MNPTPPNLHATIKRHKQNTPIRPILNWKNGPAHELTKQLHKYYVITYTYHMHTTLITLFT
jgi:hypothetical protein